MLGGIKTIALFLVEGPGEVGEMSSSSLMVSHLASSFLLADQASLHWEFHPLHVRSHLASFGSILLVHLIVHHPC